MTCIVAAKAKDGSIVMGSDSAGSDGWSLVVLKDQKIYRVGKMLIGFTSSYRMGQLLGHSLSLPEHHSDVPVERYMATIFMDAVRRCLKDGGFAKRENDVETGGTFLVAYKGRIFQVQDNFSVIENGRPYDSCGSGYMLALGSLYSTADTRDTKKRCEMALQAAEDFCATVRGPMRFETLEAA
jgi:ATP-dependent protease HslVU (ClpYQ) peptidase subunit